MVGEKCQVTAELFQEKMDKLQQELEQEMVSADELKADLEAEEDRAGELAAEIEDKSRTIEQLNRQLVSLKTSQLEASTELLRLRDAAASSGEEEHRRLEKRIKRLEADAIAAAEEHASELELLRSGRDTRTRQEVAELERRLKLDQEKYEDEVDYLNQIIENLKAKNTESLLMAENSRFVLLLMSINV
jgi:chromosome segregation protein